MWQKKKNGFSFKYCLETNIAICFICLLEKTQGVVKDTIISIENWIKLNIFKLVIGIEKLTIVFENSYNIFSIDTYFVYSNALGLEK